MSKLIKCKTCQTEMASDAKTCPKCGAPNKKKGCFTWLIYIGGGFIGLCVLGAIFSSGDKQSGTGASQAASRSSGTPAPQTVATMDVNADDLYKAYEANEVAADEKYKGKLVKVHGFVKNIGKDILDNPYVVLGGEGFLDGVQCTFPDNASSKKSLSEMNKGDSVWVIGEVEGKLGHVQVKVR